MAFLRRGALLTILLLLSAAGAQQVEFSVRHDFTGSPWPLAQVAFSDMPVDGVSTGLRLAAGDHFELGLRMRRSSSFATVGAVVGSLAADLSTEGRYVAALSLRGTVGPAAIGVRASVSDGEGELAPLREGSLPALPALPAGATLYGVDGVVSYRLARNLVLDAAPGLFLRGGAVGARLEAALRALRVSGQDDAALLLHAFAPPGFGDFSLALGVRYSINERRLPSWHLAVLLGATADGGLAPGVRVDGARLIEGGRLELNARAEPYRLDDLPYSAALRLTQDAGPGAVVLDSELGGGSGRRLHASLGVAYRLPLER